MVHIKLFAIDILCVINNNLWSFDENVWKKKINIFNNRVEIFQLMKNVQWNISNSEPYKLCVCVRDRIIATSRSSSADYQAHTYLFLNNFTSLSIHATVVSYNRKLQIILHFGFVSLLLLLWVIRTLYEYYLFYKNQCFSVIRSEQFTHTIIVVQRTVFRYFDLFSARLTAFLLVI